MKEKSGFVAAMLRLCGVPTVDDISREHIKADHVRLLHNCLTREAQELLAKLSGDADRTFADAIMMTEDAVFVASGLQNATLTERFLVEIIFASQGRSICFGQMRIVVSPSLAKQDEKRRIDARAKVQAESRHHIEEYRSQPA